MSDERLEQIIREYIDKTLHMSLATVKNNKPWVCEVHFTYDTDLNLYFRSTPGRRHSQEIAANPSVAGTIVRQHALVDSPEGLYFEGRAAVVDDQATFYNLYGLFKRRQNVDESIIEEAEQTTGHKFYRIIVDNWYAFGKFGGESSNKYTLEWNGGKR